MALAWRRQKRWPPAACLGCRGDDAGRRALLQSLEEELAEQKRRQVVDRPRQFDAVLCLLPCSVHRPGVVDEHIQLWVAGQQLGGRGSPLMTRAAKQDVEMLRAY